MKPGPKPQPRLPCRISGCGRISLVPSRQLCRAHYLRWKRYGDPEAPRRKADPWTAREDELVEALPVTRTGRAKPGTLAQLAEELGRTANAVSSRRVLLRHNPPARVAT